MLDLADLFNEIYKKPSKDVDLDNTVDTVSSTTIYGALDPDDDTLYRVKVFFAIFFRRKYENFQVLEKVKPAGVDCYTHYRVFKVDVGSQHTIEVTSLFYLTEEKGIF